MKNEAFLYSYTTPRLFERHDYVRQYTPLVRRIAHQMVAKLPANVELDDMIQAGMMGLMDAICRYEESQGTQFEVYASQRVRGAMLDELRANDWLPRSARKSQRDIENAIKGTLPAYTTADFSFGVETGRYRIELFATNLFDSNGRYSTSLQCLEIVCGDPGGLTNTGPVFYDNQVEVDAS